MDINSKYPFEIDDHDVFTVVAGDTAGEPYVITYDCDNPNMMVAITQPEKAVEFFGKNKTCAKVVYDETDGRWKFGEKDVTAEDGGITIRTSD